MNPPATTPGVTAPNASATTPDGLIVLWSERHGEVVQASAHNFQMAALQAELAHQTDLRESYESACALHKKHIAEARAKIEQYEFRDRINRLEAVLLDNGRRLDALQAGIDAALAGRAKGDKCPARPQSQPSPRRCSRRRSTMRARAGCPTGCGRRFAPRLNPNSPMKFSRG